MLKFNPTKEKGFSIVELLVVLTIIFIVSAFALMQVNSSKGSLKMQNVSTEFKAYLERARFDSVKRGTSDPNEVAKVIINSPTAFTSATDFNQNGKLEIAENRDIDFSYQNDVRFFADNLVFPAIISFNKRGHISAIDGNGNSFIPSFIVCRKSCEEIDTEPDTFQIVHISPTGTVTIIDGGEMADIAEPLRNVSTDTTGDTNPLATTIPSDGTIPILSDL